VGVDETSIADLLRLSELLAQCSFDQALVLGTIYTDAGVSGATLERPELQRLIADCRAGKVGMVITRDADRLSRDKGQLIALCISSRRPVCISSSAKGRAPLGSSNLYYHRLPIWTNRRGVPSHNTNKSSISKHLQT
jgi:hypothetical protein